MTLKPMKSPDPRDVVIAGSFRMTTDSIDGLLPATEFADGYDAYGGGYEVHRDGADEYRIVLNDSSQTLKAATFSISRAVAEKDTPLIVVPVHPLFTEVNEAGDSDGKTIRLFVRKVSDATGVAVGDIEITDRLHFILVVSNTNIDTHRWQKTA